MRCFAFWVALCPALPLCAQVQDESPAPVRTYNLLRENDDWSFLADPSQHSDFWDPIKYIPLACEACYLSLGGEIREAFEQVGNDNWGKQPYRNAFLLQRYMLQSDWHLGENFRVFVQLKSGLEDFRAGGPRPIDEKRLDFEAAFLEIGNTHKKNWAILRVGRQELN
jgi:Alginate export